MQAGTEAAPRRRRVRRQVKWGLYAVGLFLVLEYLVLPQLGRRPQVGQPAGQDQLRLRRSPASSSRPPSLVVLQPAHPHRAAPRGPAAVAAAAHQPVEPVGEPHHAGRHRAGNRRRLPAAHAVGRVGSRRRLRAWACRASAPPLVLNSILWLALLVSVFVHGYNPLYAVAAGAGVVLMGLVRRRWCWRSPGAATARSRSSAAGRPTSRSSTATSSPSRRHRVAERLGQFLAEPQVLRARHRVGGGLLVARRGLAVRVHRRAGQDRLAHRPPGRLRPGPGARRHPHHARRASA